ncbi:MAG: hypothetical protein PHS93_10040 [Candidatus Omnitrophica bacterium]|nr:hypothetical protein [Candidatus Omnitrophota bacterium]
MNIEIVDEEQKLILSNEKFNNLNFVDVVLCDERAKDKDNPRGYVAEMSVPVEELKRAVDAFWEIKKYSDKNNQ